MNDNFNIAKNFFETGEDFFLKKKYDEAEKNFNLSLKFLPDRVSTLINLGLCKIKLKEYNKCLEIINKIQTLNHNSFDFQNLKSLYFGETLQFEKAIDEIDKCLNYKNLNNFDKSNLLNYKGIACSKLSQYKESIKLQKEAVNLNENNFDAQCNLGFNNLVLENFEIGWKQYEFRLKKNNLDTSKYPIKISDIKNKKILIKAEQGIGDVIMFSRFLTDLLFYTTDITVEIPSVLKNFFRNDQFNFTTKKTIKLNNFDFEIFIGSLPYLFNKKNDFKIKSNLLNSQIFNAQVPKDKSFKVGLAWSGNENFKYDKLRSLELKYLSKLFSLKNQNVEFFCLQKDIRENDKEYFEKVKIKYLGDLNFFEVSKNIINFNLIISSDTSLLHLASTLGIKTFGLISNIPDWRWSLDRDDSYWYDNLTLFRKKQNENWEDVIDRVYIEVKDLI
ncbi:tetratricopeptide repeat protein [Candidatus Pelagibacter sp. HIMB109]|uniref:tetratricopeptide repeat protein n=1 Tax=Candidatus Pelagibacter sp. HIMB109 TaxID=3415412 RepID=UPI003F87C33C